MSEAVSLFIADMYLPVMSGSRLYHHEVVKRLDNAVVVTRHEDEVDRAAEAEFDEAARIRILRRWGIGRRFFPWLPQKRLLSWMTVYVPGVATMASWSLAEAIRSRPAVVHAGPGLSAGTAARLIGALSGTPYVIYEHGEQVADYLHRSSGLGRAMKQIFAGASAVVCNTQNTAEMVR